MSCQISLGPNDDFEVITPSGRRVYIPVSPHGVQLLWQTLWSATAERVRSTGPCPARELDNERKAAWAKIEAENAAWNQLQEERRMLEQQARKEAQRAKRIKRLAGVDIALINIEL